MERIERPSRMQGTDAMLVVVCVLLLGTGLSVLFSTSYPHGDLLKGSSLYFFRKQLIYLGVGLPVAVVAARMPLRIIRSSVPFLLAGSLVLMVLTFVPGIGRPVMGARRWIYPFGLSIQPSELVKVSLVLYLASIFDKKRDRMDDLVNTILPPLLVVISFVALTYLQNDFSTAVFILTLSVAVFYVARIPLRHFLFFGVVVIPVGVLLLFTKEHRVKRLMSFLNPLGDPSGTGFQIIAAQRAITAGGFWGKGLGQGVKKLGGLPEAHSDFIFAAMGEEIGFLGVFLVLALYSVFAWRGFSIAVQASRQEDPLCYYIAFGCTFSIIAQTLLNMSVVIGLLPATGIPLPFFSSGGSSLVVTLFMCGLLLNVSRRLAGNQVAQGAQVAQGVAR